MLPRWLKQLSHASTPRLAYSVYAAEAKEVVHDRPGPSAEEDDEEEESDDEDEEAE